MKASRRNPLQAVWKVLGRAINAEVKLYLHKTFFLVQVTQPVIIAFFLLIQKLGGMGRQVLHWQNQPAA